jgi:hypothetical protein
MSSVPQVAKPRQKFARKMRSYVARGYIVIAQKEVDGFQPEPQQPHLVGMDGDHDHLEPEELMRQLEYFTACDLAELHQKTEPLILWSE